MKRGIIILALVATVFGVTALFNQPASALDIFGIKINFWSSQTSSTTNNGKTTTNHSSTSYSYDSTKDNQNDRCRQYKNDVYVICTSYISSCVNMSLVPYYKFGRDQDTFISGFAKDGLAACYTGNANNVISNRTSNWPGGDLNVASPKIEILSIHSSGNNATLITQEWWRVNDEAGHIIYKESGVKHTLSMHHDPNNLLNEWAVTQIN